MGTSITVPEHVQARFSKKPHKQNFLPVESMPNPKNGEQPHLEIEKNSSKPIVTEKSAKIVLKSQNPLKINQTTTQQVKEPMNDHNQAALAERDCNSKSYHVHQDDRGVNFTGDGSSIWKNLSSQGKNHFKEISLKRKLTKNYRSITVIQEHDIDVIISTQTQHRKADCYQKESQSIGINCPQCPKPKQRVKLKSLSVEQQYKGSKKRVHLYLQNAENIYQ